MTSGTNGTATSSIRRDLGDQFPRVAEWASLSEPGHWPDADMLPLGYLGPSPGWGKARWTRLSPAEQRTLMTLWSIFRSPLMIGGDLPHNDPATTALLTNDEVLAVDQHSTDSRAVLHSADASVWTAKAANGKGLYVAIFNTSDHAQDLSYTWTQLGWSPGNMSCAICGSTRRAILPTKLLCIWRPRMRPYRANLRD